METYQKLKARHENEVNALPLGFAFSKEQFEEMKGNFVFNVLPFAPKETLLQIMNESYGEKL